MTTTGDTPARDETGLARKILDNLFLHRKTFWIITLLIVAADLWSKDAAISFVRNQNAGMYWVSEPYFALVDVQNRGGPWGVGREHADILRVIRLVALGVILYILMGTPTKQRLQIISLAMVMGGALGNIWDSWRYGHVRDFLHFDFGVPPADPWPAFNLADSMICVGVFLLALGMIVSGITQKKEGTRKDVAGN